MAEITGFMRGDRLSRPNVLRGIGYTCIGVALMGVMSALIKYLGTEVDYSVVQILFFRQAFALIPVLFLVWKSGGPSILKPVNVPGQITRALVGFAATLATFLALTILPLASAVALMFAAPLFITALSVPFLKEKVGVHRWGAVLVGFAGVIIVTNPGQGMLEIAALIALLAALLQAIAMIAIRHLSRTDHSLAIVFWFTVVGIVGAGVMLPFAWVTPAPHEWILLVAMGVAGGLGQVFMTLGFKNAPASVAGPFNYTSIIWATLFGYFVFAEVPTLNVLLGAAIVIASGLYIVHRERVRRRPPLAPTATTEA